MRRLNQDHGYALAFSLIFLFLVISLVAVYIMVTSNGLNASKRSADSKRAYYMADAGISDALIALRAYTTPPATFNLTNSAYALGNGKTGSYTYTAVSNGSAFATYTITSTGTFNNISRTLVLKVQQTSISSYAYFSNTEINPSLGTLWWGTGSITVGPVRTNGTLNVFGSPVFNGTVTQSGSAINYHSGTNNPSFNDGLTVNAPTIPFPTSALLNSIASGSTVGGLHLIGATTIVFNSNGTMNVTNSNKGWNNSVQPIPSNGMIYVNNSTVSSTDGNVTVKGTIKGKVTVASANQAYINGNILYSSDPRTNPASTDMFGLVSKKDVTVLSASTPSNLEIDGVMVALTGAFQLDNPAVTGKGNMVQYGSLVNSYSGATGTVNSSGVMVGGYVQLQSYDTRLQNTIPPGFLVATDSSGRIVYVKISLKEQ